MCTMCVVCVVIVHVLFCCVFLSIGSVLLSKVHKKIIIPTPYSTSGRVLLFAGH